MGLGTARRSGQENGGWNSKMTMHGSEISREIRRFNHHHFITRFFS
jgi:hypothetical protein